MQQTPLQSDKLWVGVVRRVIAKCWFLQWLRVWWRRSLRLMASRAFELAYSYAICGIESMSYSSWENINVRVWNNQGEFGRENLIDGKEREPHSCCEWQLHKLESIATTTTTPNDNCKYPHILLFREWESMLFYILILLRFGTERLCQLAIGTSNATSWHWHWHW